MKTQTGLPVVWCVMWRDSHCVIDGCEPDFLHSIHSTRKSATAEIKRMRSLPVRLKTTSYSIHKRGVLK